MKRSFAAILALVIIFSLAACDEKVKGSNEDDDKAETIVLGKYTAVFKGYTLTKDDEGNDAMVLIYDYTNGGISDGGFEQGRLKSVSGWFSDGDVEDADWLIDPDGLGYEKLICIDGSYKDPDDFFSGYDYKIYLRPWGLDWADIEEEQSDGLPDYYYDWYLPAIEAGSSMPDVIGGDYGGLAPGEVPDGQMEGQGGECCCMESSPGSKSSK